MHDSAAWLLLFTLVVIAVAAACRRYGQSAPLVLTVLGIALSFVPGLPHATMEPDLILVVLLPPLLYAAATQISLLDVKREARAILVLSVGFVIVTAAVVGAVTWWLLPVPLAAALALGSVVAPPDAVAATAVARRIGLPRRLVTVLESESLVNDATALVLLHTTIAAIAGPVTAVDLGVAFLASVVGGLAAGIGAAWLVGRVRRRISDPVTSTALSLVTPWVAFLPAEAMHGSGVLAVVVTGLILAHRAPVELSARARLGNRTNWATIQFILENSVFLLAGLQLAGTLEAVDDAEVAWSQIAVVCTAVLFTAVAVRPLWIAATAWWLNVPDVNGNRMSRGELVVASWAGMRGVVTLAAVLTLPVDTPRRDVLVLAAMTVVAGTLVAQGLTLPMLARRLRVQGPDPRADALQAATLLRAASAAGLRELDRLESDPQVETTGEALADLRMRTRRRADFAWEELGAHRDEETPSQEYRRLRLAMLTAERQEVLSVRDSGGADHEVLAQVLASLDIEESMLVAVSDRVDRMGSDDLSAPRVVRGDCEHLLAQESCPDPQPVTSTCPVCRREGTSPVHLRLCLSCGFVGCCDSSIGKHTSAHVAATGHPVVRSFEPGEVWRWCYVDDVLG